MTIEEYKANLILQDIPLLEKKLEEVNDRIVAFGLKSQGLSEQEFMDLRFNMIENYEGSYQTAYQVRQRLVFQLIEKRLEALPMEKKYFIRVMNDSSGLYSPHTETFKCIQEVNPNTMRVIRLDHYLEAKQDPDNEATILDNHSKYIKRRADGVFHIPRWKNSIFFLSDSPSTFYDYRFR